MKRFELKNIIILVLALANLCLAGVLVQRYHQQTLAQERATNELMTLFESQGVSLDATLVQWDEPLKMLTLAPDASLYLAMAQALLDDTTVTATTLDDATVCYENANGTLTFAPDGTLDASGVLGDGTMLTFIQSFCQTYGYDNLTVVSDGQRTTATATVTYRGIAVTGISLTFTLDASRLSSVQGTVLPQTHSAVGAEAQVSCLTALTHFLTTRRTTGAVVSTVTAVTACYGFTSSTTAPLTLMPLWVITTDNGTYRVDGMNGDVSYG